MPDTPPPKPLREGFTPALADALRAVLGEKGMITDPAEMRPYLTEWRGLWTGRSPAVLRPASTAECAEAVRLCAAYGVRMVPQAGNTSLVGASVPREGGEEVVISVSRMNRILEVDPIDMTMTVEAGAVLAAVQKAAEEAGCLFPLSLGAEGTAQIGGVLGTNAGGNTTLRYSRSALRWCCPTARCSTCCAGCARTTPAIACATSSSAPKARSGSSRARS
jgi:FAD/FMN-containing dehydrogenase